LIHLTAFPNVLHQLPILWFTASFAASLWLQQKLKTSSEFDESELHGVRVIWFLLTDFAPSDMFYPNLMSA